jgi:hypothetical protein
MNSRQESSSSSNSIYSAAHSITYHYLVIPTILETDLAARVFTYSIARSGCISAGYKMKSSLCKVVLLQRQFCVSTIRCPHLLYRKLPLKKIRITLFLELDLRQGAHCTIRSIVRTSPRFICAVAIAKRTAAATIYVEICRRCSETGGEENSEYAFTWKVVVVHEGFPCRG